MFIGFLPSVGRLEGTLGGPFVTLLGFLPARGLLEGALVFLIGFLPSGACVG